ncbi:hypothetical protein WA026_022204 [Henosepilachna vigintioctopunctata]|uniref:Uncharacterized protein n=1 Tax=Henosepilachna vigintioctopunctata TaxID=420089 RepID=A0AAW1URH9_9CUCU
MTQIQEKENISVTQTANLKTINGEKKTKGMVTLKTEIFNMERIIDIFVIENENFHYDFQIALNCIKKFKLMQNEDLNIIQCNNPEEEKLVNEDNEKNDNLNLTNINIPDALGDKNKKYGSLYTEVLKQETNYLNKREVNFNEHRNIDKFEISVNHLDVYQQTEIDELITKYKAVFAKDKCTFVLRIRHIRICLRIRHCT